MSPTCARGFFGKNVILMYCDETLWQTLLNLLKWAATCFGGFDIYASLGAQFCVLSRPDTRSPKFFRRSAVGWVAEWHTW